MWSGPRNISTALMYSFAQRPDTLVVDEPLYAHYLAHSDARHYHPGAEEVLASQDNDGEKVVQELILGPCPRPVLFLKNMTHHLVALDWSFLAHLQNVLLIRHPRQVILSYAKNVPHPTLQDVGYAAQIDLLHYLQDHGQQVLVLDSVEVLKNPRQVLSALCQHLDIPFDEHMLSWPTAPRPEDGVWAKYWYANVHRSTGFQPYRPRHDPFPEHLQALLAACLPLYEELAALAIPAVP
ncbi:MAG: sulfotransferase [Chloroflexi bacterium]|nr:sulfotransferase [Chloroflexota bacterium]